MTFGSLVRTLKSLGLGFLLIGRFEEVRRREQLDASVAEMLKRDYV